jgi:hypothetical protein
MKEMILKKGSLEQFGEDHVLNTEYDMNLYQDRRKTSNNADLDVVFDENYETRIVVIIVVTS